MVEITIENEIFKADSYSCSPLFARIGDTVQTLDGTDHSEGMKLKRHVVASFIDIEDKEMIRLLKASLKNNVTITYYDSINGHFETRVFKIQNDPTVPMKIWKDHLHYYEQTTVDFKEKGATTL